MAVSNRVRELSEPSYVPSWTAHANTPSWGRRTFVQSMTVG